MPHASKGAGVPCSTSKDIDIHKYTWYTPVDVCIIYAYTDYGMYTQGAILRHIGPKRSTILYSGGHPEKARPEAQ